MEFHPLNDLQHNIQIEDSDDVLSPETRRHIVLNVVAVILFVLVLLGLMQLLTVYDQVQNVSPLRYLISLGMVVGSLAVLTVLLIKEARMGERLVQSANYQSRIDQLETRLTYLDDLLEIVADHQTASTVIFDRHNRYFFVNEAAAKRIGLPAVEIIGQPPIKVLSNDQAKKLEIHLAAARASDEPIIAVEKTVTAHGTHFMQCHFEAISTLAIMSGCVLMREDDLTSAIVEKERREQMLKQVIDTLVAVVDRRDPYATGHSARVGQLSRAIALEMGLDQSLVEAAEIAGSLMNFGKVLVSRRILTKTSALSPEELQRVRDGILTSADILAIIGFEGPVVLTLRQVLERYDGTGVPSRLKGEDILITARIVAAANAFVAFVSPRAHREGLAFREALSVMAGDAGKAYDERVLLAMTHYIENRPNKIEWLHGTGVKLELPVPDEEV